MGDDDLSIIAILKMPNGTTHGCVSKTVVPMLIGEEPYSYAKCAFISNKCPFPKDVTALAKKDKIPSGICNGAWRGDIGNIDCFGDDGERYCIKDSSYVQPEPTKWDEFRKSGDGRFCSYASFKGEEYGSNVIDCSLHGIGSKEKIELVNNFIRCGVK